MTSMPESTGSPDVETFVEASGEADISSEETAPAEANAPANIEPDATLLGSVDLALSALAEITDAQTIGTADGYEVHEAHVVTLYFECRLPGYPGWRWAASLARADEMAEPTVLEVELLPGAGAVVAPDWVPWSERLAQYRETQSRNANEEAATAEAADELSAEDEVDPENDLLENDYSDFEIEIHGVDLDEESSNSDDDAEEEEEDQDVDEDGFAALDEHDLRDLHGHDDDDDLAAEADEEE